MGNVRNTFRKDNRISKWVNWENELLHFFDNFKKDHIGIKTKKTKKEGKEVLLYAVFRYR